MPHLIATGCLLPRRRRLWRDQHGIATLEFAMVAPVLVLFIMGTIEFSIIMFTTATMESATNTTSRLGKTGYVAAGGSREQQIIDSLTNRTAGLLDPSKIVIESKVYNTFKNVNKPEPCLQPTHTPCPGTPGVHFVDVNGNGTWDADMGTSGLGGPGDVVVYTVHYPWKVLTPILSNILGSTYTIHVRSVVRNEPYNES